MRFQSFFPIKPIKPIKPFFLEYLKYGAYPAIRQSRKWVPQPRDILGPGNLGDLGGWVNLGCGWRRHWNGYGTGETVAFPFLFPFRF